MKSHPILGKLAFQHRPCRAAHPRMAIGGSAPPGPHPPWTGKVVFWYWDRFKFIGFLFFVAMTLHACNSYRRSHMPCHIRHAGFVQQNIQWWSGRRFIQCCPPVGGVVRLSPVLRKHFGKISFYILWIHWGWDKMAAIFQTTFSNALN